MFFEVPADFVYASTYTAVKEIDGQAVSRVGGIAWYTNLDHERRRHPLTLLTMQENLQHNPTATVYTYAPYDNFPSAIEVPHVRAIPSDYPGTMGVPVTFLNKYCPDQFDIVGLLLCPRIRGKSIYKRVLIRHKQPLGSGTDLSQEK
jgi:hypothetical protein